MRKAILFFLIFFSINVIAQDKKNDSLFTVISKAKDDTIKVNTLIQIASHFRYSNTDTAYYFASRALALALQLNYKFGIADSKLGLSALHASKGNFAEGEKLGAHALILFNELNANASLKEKEKLLSKIAIVYQVLGHNNISQGNYPEGLKNTLSALTIQEKLGDKNRIASTQFNLGNIYSLQHNYPEALKYYRASLKNSEEMGVKEDMATCYSAISWLLIQQGNYTEALKQCNIALTLVEESKDKASLAEIFNNLGLIYNHLGHFDEALKYDFKALNFYLETGIEQQLPDIYNNIGLVYLKQKKYQQASVYFDRALISARRIGSFELIKWSYQNWFALDSATGDFKKALVDYKLSIVYRDSLFNEANAKKFIQQEMQYEFDKKEALTKVEQDKKQALAAAEIQKQKLVRNFSFAGIFVVLLTGSYGFYRFRKNKQIENQQSLLNERLRISRELHDDMGSTLSSISVYSEVAKNRAIKNENETEVLQKIGNASRELIEKMSDIVWSLNPNNENFEQLKNRMMAFAAMMLTPKGILFEFEIDDEVKSTAIAPEQRKNIFLIYKEAINNIVKYSEASSVKVKVKARPSLDSYGRVKENKLSLEVIDNGKGFDTDNVVTYNGNGLKNMKARAEEIKALFNVTSRINEGVKIELAFNI